MKMEISIFNTVLRTMGFVKISIMKAVALHFGFVSGSRPQGRYASQNAKASGQPRCFVTLPTQTLN